RRVRGLGPRRRGARRRHRRRRPRRRVGPERPRGPRRGRRRIAERREPAGGRDARARGAAARGRATLSRGAGCTARRGRRRDGPPISEDRAMRRISSGRTLALAGVAAVAGLAAQAGVAQAVAPTVTTQAATGITIQAATLHGTVNPRNLATTYVFQYGPTTS